MQQERTCMGCNKKKNQKELIRITKTKNNLVEIDLEGKKEGRGAYICKDIKCFENILKTKRLERILNCKIDKEFYEKLRGVIVDK